MYRLFFRKAAFFAFAATTFFCLNACFEDDDSSSFAPTEKEQADSDKKQDDPDNQNGSNNQGVASNGSDKCPEVTSRSQFLNPDIDYGEITDERDGQTYKTVKIGKYTWFAQNLNYAYENSVCVDPQDKNCEIYGRKYVDLEGICPEGWHVSSSDEWADLGNMAGSYDHVGAVMLKSKFGWGEGRNGLDVYGFALPPMHDGNNCSQARVLMQSNIRETNKVQVARFGRYSDYYRDYGVEFLDEFRDVDNGFVVRCVNDEENESSVGDSVLEISKLVFWDNETKEDFFNPSVNYGTLTDERDGQTYRTVQIGNQTWMAENLNYVYALESLNGKYIRTDSLYKEDGICVDYYDLYSFSEKKINTCDVFGRLYTYSAAMDSAAVFSDDGIGCNVIAALCFPNKQVRGICPEGWRLPNEEDWLTLIDAVGGPDVAGKKLKSRKGWFIDGNGTDDYGFSVTPSGVGDKPHYHTAFWTAGAVLSYAVFSFYNDGVSIGATDKKNIRCIKGYTHIDDPSRYIIGLDSSKVVRGTITDARDGQTYNTVKIGDQTWMAENLNYAYQEQDTFYLHASYCRADSTDACAPHYGRYYTWPAAMDIDGLFSDVGTECDFKKMCQPTGKVRGVCPEGWHLPDTTEWMTLFKTMNCLGSYGRINCGNMLKSRDGWLNRAGGFDFYGFNVRPEGFGQLDDYYRLQWQSAGGNAHFWTSVPDSSMFSARDVSFLWDESVSVSRGSKKSAFSIRCVKD